MTAEKFLIMRHPEFQRRTNRDLQEYDRTDFNDIIAITPYSYPDFPQERDYNRRKPTEADEYIKYDHSITQNAFTEDVPDIVLDIMEIAVATFAADKTVSRDLSIEDDVDESQLETRNIKLQIPVLSQSLTTDEMEELYSEMVSHMTHDIIEYEFYQIEKEQSVEQYSTESGIDAVSLLSDGLDSAAGVYHNQSRETSSTYATVNYGHGAGSKASKIAEETGIEHETYRVQYDGTAESTQFSRGLLHLSFAVVAASAQDASKVLCFENGIMAKFLVLSEGWMTTRTVSPLFVAYFNTILDRTLDQSIEVENPFANLTKTEIIDKIPDTEIIQQTVSCPHTARFGNQNCGFCVPCIIRNVGIISSKHEIPLDRLSKYNPMIAADFETRSLDLDIKEIRNPSANTPEIFFKGITEIAYFCRRVLENEPRQLGDEYPGLLYKTIYDQHIVFAENFMNALKNVEAENPTVHHLIQGK